MPDIDKAVMWILGVANDDTHGYSQSQRWGPDYDCSSLVISALEFAGFPVKSRFHASWTGNMRTALANAGFVDVTKSVDLRTGKGCRPGDIVLKPYAHTEMVTCISPMRLTGAHIDENGKIMGGKRGDQTGKEICTGPWYNYPWRYVFRYVEKSGDKVEIVAREVIDGKWGNGLSRMVRLQAAGYDYNRVQARVNDILKEENQK